MAFGQVAVDSKASISDFLTGEFISLLQKSKDYNSFSNKEENLKSALTAEIESLRIPINSNAIIEYDKSSQNDNEVIISDRILPFLINYAGRTTVNPVIIVECILSEDSDYHVFFESSGVLAEDYILSKAIFRKLNESFELRRISFSNELPNECIDKEEVGKDEPTITAISSELESDQIKTIAKQQIPRITIKEAAVINGQAIIYGFVQNHEDVGILIDLETNAPIKVSSRDGYFVINKTLTPSGNREVKLKYQYGSKFITDRKLLFLNPK